MRNLKEIKTPRTLEDYQKYEGTFTIFEKIEFSDISKDSIRGQIKHLKEVQVPNRTVLLSLDSNEVVFYWFRNWLHPQLKHFFTRSPRDKRGCSRGIITNDFTKDCIRNFENNQQNYSYTLQDILEYVSS